MGSPWCRTSTTAPTTRPAVSALSTTASIACCTRDTPAMEYSTASACRLASRFRNASPLRPSAGPSVSTDRRASLADVVHQAGDPVTWHDRGRILEQQLLEPVHRRRRPSAEEAAPPHSVVLAPCAAWHGTREKQVWPRWWLVCRRKSRTKKVGSRSSLTVSRSWSITTGRSWCRPELGPAAGSLTRNTPRPAPELSAPRTRCSPPPA